MTELEKQTLLKAIEDLGPIAPSKLVQGTGFLVGDFMLPGPVNFFVGTYEVNYDHAEKYVLGRAGDEVEAIEADLFRGKADFSGSDYDLFSDPRFLALQEHGARSQGSPQMFPDQCLCDIKDLMSTGHDPKCGHFKKK